MKGNQEDDNSLEKLGHHVTKDDIKVKSPHVSQSVSHIAKCFRGFFLTWGNQTYKSTPTLKSPSKQQIWNLIDLVIKSQSIWAICWPALLAVLVIFQRLLNLLFSSQQIIERVKDVCWLSIILQEEPCLLFQLLPTFSLWTFRKGNTGTIIIK